MHLSFFNAGPGPGEQRVCDALERSLLRLEERVRTRGDDPAR
ncbi:hypothetical protein [Streptomyces sp. NPDC007905]